MDNEKKIVGRNIFDLMNENKRTSVIILILLILLMLGGIGGLGWVVKKNGLDIAVNGFNLRIPGMTDTLSRTETSMKITAELFREIASKTDDPKKRDEYLKLAGQADEIVTKTKTNRDRLLSLNGSSPPDLQEGILKDILVDYGVSEDIISKVNFGIVDKYVENEDMKSLITNLQEELRLTKDENHKLRHEIADKDRIIGQLKKQVKLLEEELEKSETPVTGIVNRPVPDYQSILDSLNASIQVDSSVYYENERLKAKQKNIRPFYIEFGDVSLDNVGTKKDGSYKTFQIKNNSYRIKLIPKKDPNFTGLEKSSYTLTVETHYKGKNGVNQIDKNSIEIKPGTSFDKQVAFQKGVGKGTVYVTIYFEGNKVWSDFLPIGKIDDN